MEHHKHNKVDIEPRNHLYPVPLTLLGASVLGKASYFTLTGYSVMHYNPAVVSVVLSRSLKLHEGILQNRAFSLSLPTPTLLSVIGLDEVTPGSVITEKAGLLEVFSGKQTHAPLIVNSPLGLECKLVQTLEYSNDSVFIGKIVAAYGQAQFLDTNGKPDPEKAAPVFTCLHEGSLWRLGECLGPLEGYEKEFGVKKKA